MTNVEVVGKVMENFVSGKHTKKYMVVESHEEYGGTVFTLLFHEPPNGRELNRAVNELTAAPFGFGVRAGKIDGICCKFRVKVYND